MEDRQTLIVEMDPKICASVCTLFVKGHGCQAPKTNENYGRTRVDCAIGKPVAEARYRRNQGYKKK